MNLQLNLYHNEDDTMCAICNCKAIKYLTHIKSKKHQYNRENLVNKILIKELMEKEGELDLLKKESKKIIKMYLSNEICPICLDETKKCFSGMFDCDHSCCEDCFSKIDKCSLCRSGIKS